MLFLFGRSVPVYLSRYFSERAQKDGHQVVFASMGEFPDGEPFAELHGQAHGELCVVFQSITNAGGFNASSHYMQMLALADDLKRIGAKAIWAVNPMAGFMRQDRMNEEKTAKGIYESVLSDLSGRLMKEAGFVGMSTIEAHSNTAMQNYEIGLGEGNIINLNPNDLFARVLKKRNISVKAIASPDFGADARANDLANKFGVEHGFSVQKKREKGETHIVDYQGKVDESTALIDDIASTLGTARKALDLIYDHGARNNVLLISHPVMIGNAWDNIAKLLKMGRVSHVMFLHTLSRDAEFIHFTQQYGPDIADKVIFIEDELSEMLYEHVTQDIANHPAMQMEVT